MTTLCMHDLNIGPTGTRGEVRVRETDRQTDRQTQTQTHTHRELTNRLTRIAFDDAEWELVMRVSGSDAAGRGGSSRRNAAPLAARTSSSTKAAERSLGRGCCCM